ncbi:MAG: hypothetical protein FWC97_03025, partial [Treponema sp.]|nr:hypothetical protein [Treponema sp.]
MKKNKLPRALVTTLLLSLALVTTLTGCGDDDPAPPSARARSVTVMPNTENPGSAYQQREGTLNYFITIEGDSGIFPVDLLGNNVQIGRLVAGQFQEVAGLSISSTTRFVAASGWETALTLLIDGDLIPAGTHSFAILVHGVDAVFQAGILDPAPVRFAIEELRNLWDVGNLPSTLTISTDIGNELLRPQLLAFGGASVAITIRGTSSNNTLTLADTGPIFTVGTGVTLILEDIELVGINNNNNSLVVLNGGTLEMRSGSVIRGNTSDNVATGGGVTINANGTFNMSGGTISGNTASSNENNAGGGGVRINHGTFNMSADAVITGNRQLGGVNVSNSLGGGGVRVSGPTATFNMLGGTISNNSATRSGGGVRVVAGRFHISGGTVYGTNDAAALRNTAARESSLSTEPGLGQPPANFARGTALVGTTFNTINVGNSGLGIGTNFTVEVAGGALLRPIAPESFTVTGIDSEHDGRLFRVLLRGGGDWISLGGVETEITIPDTTIEVWPVWTVGLGDWDLALEIWDLDQGNVSDHVLDLELKENEYLTLELGKDNFIAFSDFTVPTRVTGVTITGIEQTYITDGAWRLYSSDNGWDSWINIPGPGLVIANFPDNSVAVNLSG